MPALILPALLLLPFLEIAVFIEVGERIGAGPTVLLVLLSSLLGIALVRSAGLATLARAQAAIALNEPPVEALLDGLAMLLAGVLLAVPGFITSVLGLLLLLRTVRRAARRSLWSAFAARERRRRGLVIETPYSVEEPQPGPPPRLGAEPPR